MTDLSFACLEVRPESFSAAPTLVFRLRIRENTGADVRAIALRCQLRIQPAQRAYTDAEAQRLSDLFGARERWGSTLLPLQFATVTSMVPAFRGGIEIELPVPCSYDLEVACGRYFQALQSGEVPLLLLFTGTVFTAAQVEMVRWDRECAARMPVKVWQALMDDHFPDSGWLRLRRDTLNELEAYRRTRALSGWDETIRILILEASAGGGA